MPFLPGMQVATRFEELVTWQRLYELSVEVHKATVSGAAARDADYCEQIRDASDSAQRNVAEGFGRFDPPQFANFLNFSRGSAQETRALLRKGLDAGYFTRHEYARLDKLAVQGLQLLARFQRYLRSSAAKRNAARRYRRSPPRRYAPNDAKRSEPNDPNAAKRTEPNDPNAAKRSEPNDPNEAKRSEPNDPNEAKRSEPNDPNEAKRSEPNDPNVPNDRAKRQNDPNDPNE